MRRFLNKLFGSKPTEPGTIAGPLTEAERRWLDAVVSQDTKGW